MNLDFFKNLNNDKKDNNIVQNFIKELGNYIEQKSENNISNQKEILKEIQDNRNTSIISRNTIRNAMAEILTNYANKTINNGEMYFISSKKDDTYTLLKYENGEQSAINISENELPVNVCVNSVLRKQEGNYIVNQIDTQNVINSINETAEEILNKQDEELRNFRKENHVYMVEEDRNGRIYLTDKTNNDNSVLEEVDFPKELLQEATEGAIFEYKDGKYELYSKDGLE